MDGRSVKLSTPKKAGATEEMKGAWAIAPTALTYCINLMSGELWVKA
ncbi:hypothetical protein LAJPDJIK_00834 [Aeromonas salmonicida]